MTLLITSPVDRKDHAECASQLMKYESVHAEQTGFVEKPRNEKAVARLQMAGGEFCGNAAMALAALIARDKKLMRNGTHPLLLEVSWRRAGLIVRCQPSRMKKRSGKPFSPVLPHGSTRG